MSQFEIDWLAARRPRDHTSRATPPRSLLNLLENRRNPLKIIDLGAGTGSNSAFLAPTIVGEQRWTLVDQDEPHRAHVEIPNHGDVSFEWQTADISTGLAEVILGEPDLVTASAFLDLVSADWVEALVACGTAANAAFLFALTYDGVQGYCPPHPIDADIATLFNRHQRTDKGFGPALGPAATALLREKLQDAGYHVETRGTPWRLGRQDADFIDILLTGITASAKALASSVCTEAIDAWLSLRRRQAYAGELSLTIGHQDLFAWPANAQSNSVSAPSE